LLYIVESPTKANKIKSYGKNAIYTFGHISELDFTITNNINNIKIIPKKSNFSYIENAIKKAKKIVIATDPDQEGEKIAYVISQIANKHKKEWIRNPMYGMSTRKLNDVLELKNARQKIDENIVLSVFSRQIMDYMLSNTFSKIIEKKLGVKGFKLGRIQHNILLLLDTFKNFKRYSIKNYKFLLKDNIDNIKIKIEKNQRILKINKPFTTGSVIEDFLINEERSNITKVSKLLQKLYLNNFITYPRTDGLAMEQDSFNLLYLKAKKIFKVDYYYYDNNYQNALSPLKLEIDLHGDISKLFYLIMRRSIAYLIKPYIIHRIDYEITLKNKKHYNFSLGLDEKNILNNIYLPNDVFDNQIELDKYLFLGEGLDEYYLMKILNILKLVRPSTLGYIMEVLYEKELIEKSYNGELTLLPLAQEIISVLKEELPFLDINFYKQLAEDINFIEKGLNNYKFPILKLQKYLKNQGYNIDIIDLNISEEEIEYKKLWNYDIELETLNDGLEQQK